MLGASSFVFFCFFIVFVPGFFVFIKLITCSFGSDMKKIYIMSAIEWKRCIYIITSPWNDTKVFLWCIFHVLRCFSRSWKWKSLSHVQLFVTPWAIQSMEVSRPEYWSEYPFLSPEGLPNPGIKLRSPALQVDSLPTESQRKPKNTGMSRLSLLQQIFPTLEYQGLLLCRWILYQLNYQGSPFSRSWKNIIKHFTRSCFHVLYVCVTQCLLMGGGWWFCPLGHIWQHLETCLIITTWEGLCYWHLVWRGHRCC